MEKYSIIKSTTYVQIYEDLWRLPSLWLLEIKHFPDFFGYSSLTEIMLMTKRDISV